MNAMPKLSLVLIGLMTVYYSAFTWAVTAVNPNGVNVNHTGATTVFLTFQNLAENETSPEAFWCAKVTSTGASNVNPCVPGTILGKLPRRNNLSRISGTGGQRNFTDIMTIPPSVARRAFQRARQGNEATFFYVRRFTDGVNDTYVTVTCRMAGGGARSPLALTSVKLTFQTPDGNKPIYFISQGEALPELTARIKFNGTGRLKGRWEIVMPGDQEPSVEDLLTEASLPVEKRAFQKRYTIVERFDVFLPPTGRFVLKGPNPKKIPNNVNGAYKILLRVEATADKEGNSKTLRGTVVSGGVAGFPMPVLRYYVGSKNTLSPASGKNPGSFTLLSPLNNVKFPTKNPLFFSWVDYPSSVLYKLEVRNETEEILSALVHSVSTKYIAPPWIADHAGQPLSWRVTAMAKGGSVIATSKWKNFILVE